MENQSEQKKTEQCELDDNRSDVYARFGERTICSVSVPSWAVGLVWYAILALCASVCILGCVIFHILMRILL